MLADGAVFWGRGFSAPARGAGGTPVGEVSFDTGMTGYQETLTDPSCAAQNSLRLPLSATSESTPEDIEATTIAARGLVVKQDVTEPSNWRGGLDAWLRGQGVTGVCGVETRAVTVHIRDGGARTACWQSGMAASTSPPWSRGRGPGPAWKA